MNRILIEQREILTDFSVTLKDRRAQHILKTLKPQLGQTLRIGILNGPRGEGTIIQQNDHTITLSCALETTIPPTPPLDLLLAMPRPRIMRRLWPQLSALGLGHIIISGASKVEKYYFDSRALLPQIIEPLLIDGLEQAGDTLLPQITIHRKWHDTLALIEKDYHSTLNLIAAEQSDTPLKNQQPNTPPSKTLLAIGPEGGWILDELIALTSMHFQAFTLGPRILRSDTACVSAIALVNQLIHE